MMIDFSIVNVTSVLIIFISTFILYHSIIKYSLQRSIPLINLMLVGFNFSTQLGALLFKCMYFDSVSNNLDRPIFTFLYSALFQFGLLLSALIYKSKFIKFSENINKNILVPMSLLKMPKKSMLFFLGYLGLFSLLYQAQFVGTTSKIEYGDVSGKFIQSLTIFVSAPYLVLFYSKLNPYLYYSKKNTTYLIIYSIILIGLAIALNFRGMIFTGIFNLLVVFGLYFSAGMLDFKITKLKVFLCVLAIPIISISSDFVFAMAIARENRGVNSPVQMFVDTIDIFLDRDQLKYLEKVSQQVIESEYSEIYIGNSMIDRLLSVKFVDITTSHISDISEANTLEIINATQLKIAALIPTQFLLFFGGYIDKNDTFFSIGDFIRYASGDYFSPSFLTGSNVAHAIILLGYLSFLLLIPFFIFTMIFINAFQGNSPSGIVVSPIILINIMYVFNYFVSDSLIDGIQFMFRALPQFSIMYFILFSLIAKVNKN